MLTSDYSQTSLLICLSVRQSADRIETIRTHVRDLRSFIYLQSDVGILSSSHDNKLSRPWPMSKWHNQIIGTTSWLRKFGFYGSFTAISRADKFNKSRITVGFKLPTWVASKSVILEVQFSNF